MRNYLLTFLFVSLFMVPLNAATLDPEREPDSPVETDSLIQVPDKEPDSPKETDSETALSSDVHALGEKIGMLKVASVEDLAKATKPQPTPPPNHNAIQNPPPRGMGAHTNEKDSSRLPLLYLRIQKCLHTYEWVSAEDKPTLIIMLEDNFSSGNVDYCWTINRAMNPNLPHPLQFAINMYFENYEKESAIQSTARTVLIETLVDTDTISEKNLALCRQDPRLIPFPHRWIILPLLKKPKKEPHAA